VCEKRLRLDSMNITIPRVYTMRTRKISEHFHYLLIIQMIACGPETRTDQPLLTLSGIFYY